MLSIRLDKDMEERLDRLAKGTGRTKSYYARMAIHEKIEDMEDYLLAEKALKRIREGKDDVLSRDAFLKLVDKIDNDLDD